MSGNCNPRKPSALVVFLENVGHIHGIPLPQWMMNVIDYATEEYAKFLLRLLGAYRLYEAVIILEDEAATGPRLAETLIETSQTHQIDLLLLVHGQEGALIGYKARESVGKETFSRLRSIYHENHSALDLRMVFGLNCYGITLAPLWLELGAQVPTEPLALTGCPSRVSPSSCATGLPDIPFRRRSTAATSGRFAGEDEYGDPTTTVMITPELLVVARSFTECRDITIFS